QHLPGRAAPRRATHGPDPRRGPEPHTGDARADPAALELRDADREAASDRAGRTARARDEARTPGNATTPATDCAPLQHRRAVRAGDARVHPHAPACRRGARPRDLYPWRHRSDRETLGRNPAPGEHPVRSLSRRRVRRSEAIDRARCRKGGVRVPRRRHVTEASIPATVTQCWLSLRRRAHGARADPMSKFIEALEQAERDRALCQSPDVAPVSAPVAIDDVPLAPAPVAELPDGVRVLDQHLVSLLKPTSF